jgi:phosphopantothenoylcysteine decarboxylase/phosphopantothenate--cysteine ligase
LIFQPDHSSERHFFMTDQSSQRDFPGKKVALGITGGIAAYKAAEILRGLQRAGCTVRVAMTKRACEFIQPLTFRALSGAHVVVDDYAPDNPDPIAHITFSQSVDLFLVAPATANIIAKFANGVADDFLSSTYLASQAPVLIAPAMNTTMWEHPATQRNLARLREDGVRILDPDAGEMACGTIGPGRLSDPEKIVQAALAMLNDPTGKADLASERILITVGATREEIDPVRFISNRSSGRMGFAIAEAANARGADVVVVAGFTTVDPPANIKLIRVKSAAEMHAAVMGELETASIFIGAAAVADYRPAKRAEDKIKKSADSLELALERTEDILRDVALRRSGQQLVVGFAAETNNVLENARTKLETKGLDLLVANDVTKAGAGFDSSTNIITIIGKDDARELPLMSKRLAADRILDEVVRLRGLKGDTAQVVGNSN